MRRIALIVALAAVGFTPPPSRAQDFQGDDAARRSARLMDRLRDELWEFRKELDFFRRTPEYNQLIELRYQIRNFAIEMAEAKAYNEDIRSHAREMARAGRELYHLAEHLEDRLDAHTPEVRRRADSLHEHAVEVRVLIGRLHEVIHLDYQNNGPDQTPSGPPSPRRLPNDRR